MSTLAAAVPVPLRQDAPTIGLVSVAHGLSHFTQLIVPPLFPWIGAAFGINNTQLGLLVTVFFVVSWIGQMLAGFLVDRFGARRVLYLGMASLALGAFGLSASPSYGVMLFFMAVAGLGNSVFHPVDFSILNGRISTQRLGHAYAAHGISGNLGWALAPVFVVGITHVASWRAALASAGVVITLVLLALVVWRDVLDPMPKRAGQVRAPATAAAGVSASTFGFLRLPAVWYSFLFFLLYAIGLGGVQTFGPAAAGQLHGVAPADVAICLSVYMVSAAAAMVVGGYLVRDPARSAKVVGLGFGIATVVALAIAFGHWPGWAVPILFAAMGFGAGIAGPSRDLLVKQATPPGATGRVYGVVYSGLDVGQALAPILLGVLMDNGQYRAVWLVVAVSLGLLVLNGFNLQRRSSAPRAVGQTA